MPVGTCLFAKPVLTADPLHPSADASRLPGLRANTLPPDRRKRPHQQSSTAFTFPHAEHHTRRIRGDRAMAGQKTDDVGSGEDQSGGQREGTHMPVAKRVMLVLDCAEPEALADFYATLLDAQARRGLDPDFVEVAGPGGVHLAIRRDHGLAPPSWPRPDDAQQAHLHVLVDQHDMDEAEREVIGLGARPLDTKDNAAPRDVRIYSEPAGHTFSLIAREGRTQEQMSTPEPASQM